MLKNILFPLAYSFSLPCVLFDFPFCDDHQYLVWIDVEVPGDCADSGDAVV